MQGNTMLQVKSKNSGIFFESDYIYAVHIYKQPHFSLPCVKGGAERTWGGGIVNLSAFSGSL